MPRIPHCLPSTYTSQGKHNSGFFIDNFHVLIYGSTVHICTPNMLLTFTCFWIFMVMVSCCILFFWLFLTLFLRFPSMFMYVTVFHLFSPLCSIPLYDYHNLLICFSVHGDLDYFQYLAIMNAVVNILLTTM